MFDPTIGRWLTEDPTGFDAGDADLYRYVGNDPTNETDPTGLDPNVKPVEVFPPKAGNYGAFIWPIKWSLAKDAGSGIIMQRIDVKVNIRQPGGDGTSSSPAPWSATLKGKGDPVFKHWIETWRVTGGKVVDESAVLAKDEVRKLIQQDFPENMRIKGPPYLVPVFGPDDIKAVANDWFMGINAGRVPGKAEPRTTWGYISVTAQARFYPGMTRADLVKSGFKEGSGGWSGSGYLWSYAWRDDGPAAEKNALDGLAQPGMIFAPGSGNTDFRDIKSEDLATRRFVVYWNSDGATTILQGKEAEDANLDEIMKTLRLKP